MGWDLAPKANLAQYKWGTLILQGRDGMGGLAPKACKLGTVLEQYRILVVLGSVGWDFALNANLHSTLYNWDFDWTRQGGMKLGS
jgi:hypothetical protein